MKSKTAEEHKKLSPKTIKCSVITLSDSKSKTEDGKKTDKSGHIIIAEIEKKYELSHYEIISDNENELLSTINMIKNNSDVIFTTGGTGISSRDITVETLQSIFEKELTGFGEIFRYETYKDLGSTAFLSRATGGIFEKTLIFAMPGSPNAVKLGLSLIIDELGHLTKHLKE
ncbi:MogA/MoaB family molybdenum cofactor biosynthesis protein [Methanobrevibacter curvatus]|uniref:Molybdenum cofactor biosynthesis protein B n=1 Tax=Methanobrevibacter curvatus TaxID=49547 RepID=A0A166CBZ5_9EURY|nr:molybdenum cofactor biosynthesis protein B [Methanobrevibacter curvatus]KZX14352.1 molybdenum cofactor biosynthesis protein B [Methanobrevibacter curvatus]